MNLRVHPVRVGVLDHLDEPGSKFIVRRSSVKKKLMDVCLSSDLPGNPTRPLILYMSIGSAIATAQALNAIMRKVRGTDDKDGIEEHGGGYDIREVPGSDPRTD